MAEGAAPSDGHFQKEVPSNLGQDNNVQEVQPSEALQDGISSPHAEELTKGTATASSSMKSINRVDPKTEENVNSPSNMSSSTLGSINTVRDALGSEEHTLAVGRPPSSSTKRKGKAIEDYDEKYDGEASSTEIILKATAEAGPSVGAPAQHDDEVVATIGNPAHPNASDSVASTAAPAIPIVAQQDVNAPAIAVIGPAPAQINGEGGIVVIAAHPALVQPNAAPTVPIVVQQNVNAPAIVAIVGGPPAPAQINGGRGIAARPAPAQPNAARPAPAQANARGPAPNAAPPVPALPPNPGVNYIDEVLMNSGIRPLRNPAHGEEGKLWDRY